ncbi:hypothetical protein PG985_001649 [Apiospora marii]|uniref:uncharacterized protein n=1 Tax=Apiospora marii TaxID=335849 RepID=UPI003131C411
MAAVIDYLFPKGPDFTWHRPGAFDRAYGRTWGQGIDANLPERAEINAALQYIVEHPEVERAWDDYVVDFLLAPRSPGNKTAAFPPFHEVEGFLNFLIEHEALQDFMHLGKDDALEDKGQWDHKAHVAAFVFRLLRQRMRDEKLQGLPAWRTGHFWCAAHVLWELLHWRHTEWQRTYIAEHEGSKKKKKPALAMYAAVAPGVGLQSYAPKSLWGRIGQVLFRTV